MGSLQSISIKGYSSNLPEDIDLTISQNSYSSDKGSDYLDGMDFGKMKDRSGHKEKPKEQDIDKDKGDPSLPSGSERPSDVEVEFVDLDDLADENIPEIPYIDINITDAKNKDDDEIAIKDDQGTIYYLKNYDGSWKLTKIENSNGEQIDIDYNTNLEYIIELFQGNGLTIKGITFSKENGFVKIMTDQGDFIFDYELKVCKYFFFIKLINTSIWRLSRNARNL